MKCKNYSNRIRNAFRRWLWKLGHMVIYDTCHTTLTNAKARNIFDLIWRMPRNIQRIWMIVREWVEWWRMHGKARVWNVKCARELSKRNENEETLKRHNSVNIWSWRLKVGLSCSWRWVQHESMKIRHWKEKRAIFTRIRSAPYMITIKPPLRK